MEQIAKEKIFEVRIVDVSRMPEHTRREVARKASEQGDSFDYQGFARVVYVTASPKRIASVEPIRGTPVDYYKETMGDVDFAVF